MDKLIDQDTKWWNREALELLFSEEEVKRILTIPLSHNCHDHIQYWKGSKNELFTVRSAYHLHKEMVDRSRAGSSVEHLGGNTWKRLWALPIPNNEKNFLCRACNDILPTRENLWRKKILTDPSCPFCEAEVESCFHIMWQCPSARDV